ncbi:Uncharacterised protein [Vibrio cholerae]|nr:Uncharacterised protein [Vibrio cholerae]
MSLYSLSAVKSWITTLSTKQDCKTPSGARKSSTPPPPHSMKPCQRQHVTPCCCSSPRF